jgi:hypothetical protein
MLPFVKLGLQQVRAVPVPEELAVAHGVAPTQLCLAHGFRGVALLGGCCPFSLEGRFAFLVAAKLMTAEALAPTQFGLAQAGFGLTPMDGDVSRLAGMANRTLVVGASASMGAHVDMAVPRSRLRHRRERRR